MIKSKPDWKYAPKWARYMAQDAIGRWFWYSVEQEAVYGEWRPISHVWSLAKNGPSNPNWRNTLEKRP